ncbi:MAG TPA: hypothetical protein VFD92_08835 [Candidatus Binatia bacterium]|nr:hypothetical protein [Candidatus Binatia bacterium]
MTTDLSGPSVTEVYGFGWSELKRSFLELLLIGVVWLLLSSVSGYLRGGLVGLAYEVLVLGPVTFGGMWAFLRAARGETPDVADLFAAFRIDYWQAVLASVLLHAIIAIGFVLLVVPGVIAAVRLSWVPYIVIDERVDAITAVRESWERTRGHGWTIFGIWLLAIPIVLVGIALLVVGIVPALMWVQLASACYYAAIATRERAARDAGLAPA